MNNLSSPSHIVPDPMDPARADALRATLNIANTDHDVLPPFFHQVYFWQALPPDQLGRDGHPKRGGVIPDMGLPRRMWAGGRLQFHRPLRVRVTAEKHTSVVSAKHKTGRTGPLGFVTLRHDIWQDGKLVVTEDQDLVYREDPDPNAPLPQTTNAPLDQDSAETVNFTSTLLFRYSALTMNGHRIHYDLDYCRHVEGYAGLVVHGPLLAQLLMLKAERELGALAGFGFRAASPVLHNEAATLCRKGNKLWVRGEDGRLCMQAEVFL